MKARLRRSSYWNCGGSDRNHTGRRIPGYLEAEARKIRDEVQGRRKPARRPVEATSADALLASSPELLKLFLYG